MKILFSVISFLVAIIAWLGAVVDFALAKISERPRPHLVPLRTFFAAYRVSKAYLAGKPLHLNTFRIRSYPRQFSSR